MQAGFPPQLPRQVANRTLLAQSAVDGVITLLLYTVPTGQAGVYRISSGILPRTKSSTPWVVNADHTPPAGTNIAAQIGMGMAMSTGVPSSQPVSYSLYLHDGDQWEVGTVTVSGSNTSGLFDVQWTLEKLS